MSGVVDSKLRLQPRDVGLNRVGRDDLYPRVHRLVVAVRLRAALDEPQDHGGVGGDRAGIKDVLGDGELLAVVTQALNALLIAFDASEPADHAAVGTGNMLTLQRRPVLLDEPVDAL